MYSKGSIYYELGWGVYAYDSNGATMRLAAEASASREVSPASSFASASGSARSPASSSSASSGLRLLLD